MATYDAVVGLLPEEFPSARDDNGHGTHTTSTAAGNARVEASVFGVPRGRVSGIAPRAHVAMYKVCGFEGCYTSDSAAAVQQAILDGVSVINFSIAGGANPYSDAVELAFLDAYNAGVFVAASAGNSGPGANTTDHRGPWVTTVAASTQRRSFVSQVAAHRPTAARRSRSRARPSPTASSRPPTSSFRRRPTSCASPRSRLAAWPARSWCAGAGRTAAWARALNALAGRGGGHDPLQPVRRRHGPGDRQPLPADEPRPVRRRHGPARVHRREHERQGDAHGRRSRARARATSWPPSAHAAVPA